ncbi:tRNA (adenosine(37)-N6)-threonylcarbamoyltransferase complex ATPase subunit type 1 TsaE [Candidatus Omnitrophota bacterium]
MKRMVKIVSPSEKATIRLGRKLAGLLSPGSIVCLFGQLGAGKTILVKGMAEGLGVDRNEVISPSFVLIREYLPGPNLSAGKPLFHLDLFRLKSPRDIFSLGYEEYVYDKGICAIEWAERLGNLLPAEFLKVQLEVKGATERVIRLTAQGRQYLRILKGMKK